MSQQYSREARFFASMVTAAVFVSGLFLYGYHRGKEEGAEAVAAASAGTPAAASASAAPPPSAGAAAGPPCVREVCAERPGTLWCAEMRNIATGSDGTCYRWKILYEHHCDCVEWAGPQ